MKNHSEKQTKKLVVRTIVFFILTLLVWAAACLLADDTAHYHPVLAALSLIPSILYLLSAYQLITALRSD